MEPGIAIGIVTGQPAKGRVAGSNREHAVIFILILPPLLLPLSCVSAPSPPKFPTSQLQAFHRGNISAKTEGSEEQVVRGMFTNEHCSKRGCFTPMGMLDEDGSIPSLLPNASLPSPAFPSSSREDALSALPHGFELPTSTKTHTGRLYTAAIVAAS